MLRAANDRDLPYLLVLDEMNLAHVERYFADVLSGMESGTACLPNLARGPELCWQLTKGQPERVPVPDNLFVVGTVNVDETTYMFSPKVLDRANTIEFRVHTSDLLTHTKRPQPCAAGPEDLVRGFLEVARDSEWQSTHEHVDLKAFSSALRALHSQLTGSGFEFAHRVYYEAVRFAAILQSAGEQSVETALDLQVMQKVLPRLHGSRRRLEPILAIVGRFAYDLLEGSTAEQANSAPFDPLATGLGAARLPRSFEKVQRMTRILRANQFVSFTE
jgi:5-methylcytosine-specific restriction protein B